MSGDSAAPDTAPRPAAAWSASEIEYMQHALGLAALGLNTTDPNPRVGCVLVRGGKIVGEGWHERAGRAHAEVAALQSAGELARGASAFVTLEPCAASGRTPPCTEALLAAGVVRVVYAGADPHPHMQGGGELLRRAGVQVASGLLAGPARDLNLGFYSRFERARPWLRLKLGVSLDGRTGLADGESRWVTAKPARTDAQWFRARSSAVLTGIGTVLRDDPALNVRLDGATRQPLRVVLDSALRAPPSARMFEREGPALIFASEPAVEHTGAADWRARRAQFEARGVRVECVAAASGGGLELRAVLNRLAQLEVNELWVEAGARLAGSLLAQELVDELVLYVAPCLLGPQALPLALIPDLSSLDSRLRFSYHDISRTGEDLRIVLRPAPQPAHP